MVIGHSFAVIIREGEGFAEVCVADFWIGSTLVMGVE
jgi:hypothetical protein